MTDAQAGILRWFINPSLGQPGPDDWCGTGAR